MLNLNACKVFDSRIIIHISGDKSEQCVFFKFLNPLWSGTNFVAVLALGRVGIGLQVQVRSETESD
jgi:hypothetical protein